MWIDLVGYIVFALGILFGFTGGMLAIKIAESKGYTIKKKEKKDE